MRKKLIVANWKMNKTYSELDKYISEFKSYYKSMNDKVDVAIASPFVFLDKMSHLLRDTPIQLTAQNAHWEAKGAYTGEISFPMLRELHVSSVILGHSERRQYFGESDEALAKKVKSCFENNMTAILCVGETLEQRKAEKTFSVIEKQIDIALGQISNIEKLVIAYEPVWAIGTGVSASVSQAQEVHSYIRNLVEKLFSGSQKLRILYGGSMNASNCKDLLEQKDIDGGLIGGASLDARNFFEIISNVK